MSSHSWRPLVQRESLVRSPLFFRALLRDFSAPTAAQSTPTVSPETRSSLRQLLSVCDRIDFLPKDWVPQLCLFSGLGVFEGDSFLRELSCPGRGWSGVGSQRGLTAFLSLRNPFGLPLPWGAEARASTQAHRSVLPQLWADLTQGWRLSGLRQ